MSPVIQEGRKPHDATPSLTRLRAAPAVDPAVERAVDPAVEPDRGSTDDIDRRISAALAARDRAYQRGAAVRPIQVVDVLSKVDSATLGEPARPGTSQSSPAASATLRGFIAGVALAAVLGPVSLRLWQATEPPSGSGPGPAFETSQPRGASQEERPQGSQTAPALAQNGSPRGGVVHDPLDRLRIKFPDIPMQLGGQSFHVPHPVVRIAIAKQAADRAGLREAGLTWRDVYAIIHAESSWVARDGMGLNGKVSRGVAQLEDATARSLGINDPDDLRQSALAAAMLAKEGAVWANAKRHVLRKEAISVYYNTSTRLRNQWDGEDLKDLPAPTRRHIVNVTQGRQAASKLEVRWEKELRSHGVLPRLGERPAPKGGEGAGRQGERSAAGLGGKALVSSVDLVADATAANSPSAAAGSLIARLRAFEHHEREGERGKG